MKKYQVPKWEIVLFPAEDVIRTSDDEDGEWTGFY